MPARSDHRTFIAIIERWLQDSRFLRLSRYTQTRHWLDGQTLHESNFRDFLAWILSPREGHGLGDYFLRRLFAAAMADAQEPERIRNWIKAGMWPSLARLERMSFTGAHVATEVNVEQGGAKGRIDLLLVDPANELVVMIERKDGSRVSPSQLKVYEDWARNSYPSYFQLLLVLDSYENEHLNLRENWLQINDDWLSAAIDEVIDREQLPDMINRQLKEFRALLSGSALWEGDAYYQGIKEDIAALAAAQAADIQALRRLRAWPRDDAPLLVHIDQHSAVQQYLPRVLAGKTRARDVNGILCAIDIAAKYHEVLDALMAESVLVGLQKEILRHPEYASVFNMSTKRDRRGNDWLYVTLRRLSADDWPVWVAIRHPRDGGDGGSSWAGRKWMVMVFDLESDIDDDLIEAWHTAVASHRSYNKEGQRKVRAYPQLLEEISFRSVRPLLEKLLSVDSALATARQPDDALVGRPA